VRDERVEMIGVGRSAVGFVLSYLALFFSSCMAWCMHCMTCLSSSTAIAPRRISASLHGWPGGRACAPTQRITTKQPPAGIAGTAATDEKEK